MPKRFDSRGIISVPLVLVFALLLGLTVFAASRSYVAPEQNLAPSPSPSEISTPEPSPSESPSLSPSPSPSPTPIPTPKPSVTPTSPATPSTAPAGGATGGGNIQTDRGSFRATVVTLPISAQMITDTANDSDCAADCPTKPLADYVNHFGGYAGIVGTYTCPADYADCASKKNSFDFSVYNTRLGKWINEGNLGWGGRSMIYQDNGGTYHYQQNAGGVGGIRAGIVNYPGILNNGQITVEGGSLSAKQGSKGTKSGMGFNGSNIFLVVAYNVDMYDFASIFKTLGAQNALNLDGGGSAALYNGGYKAGPGRNLPNAIVFK